MNFTVCIKTPTGRTAKLNCIADNFETCLKKISALYGKNLLSITYDLRKNPEATVNGVSRENFAQ